MSTETDNRAEKIAGMRELLDFLEQHPVIPLPNLATGYTLYPKNSAAGQDIPAALDELREVGAAIGSAPHTRYGRHVYLDGPTFRGGVDFEAIVCDGETLFKQQQADAEAGA